MVFFPTLRAAVTRRFFCTIWLVLALTLAWPTPGRAEGANAYLMGGPLSAEPAPIIDREAGVSPRAYGLDGADYLLGQWRDVRQSGDEAAARWLGQSFGRFMDRWGHAPADGPALAGLVPLGWSPPLKPPADLGASEPPGLTLDERPTGGQETLQSSSHLVWSAHGLGRSSQGSGAAPRWPGFAPSGWLAKIGARGDDDQAALYFQELDGDLLAGEAARGGVVALEYRLGGHFSLAGGAGALQGFGRPGAGHGLLLDDELRRAYFLAAPYRVGEGLLVQPELSLTQGGPSAAPSQRVEDDWLLGVNVQFDF